VNTVFVKPVKVEKQLSYEDQDTISQLDELLRLGVLSKEDRDKKVALVTGKHSSKNQSQMSDEDVQVLEKLEKLFNMGVLTDEEYHNKQKQIIDKY